MLVDLVALLLGQCAAGDTEVVKLALVVEQFRNGHFEAPPVVFRHPVLCLPFQAVFGLVGQ